MTSIKQAIGAMLIAGGAFGLFVACSTDGDSCVTQADCGADQVCDASECTDICTTDDQCPAGKTCELAASGSGQVCKTDPGTNNGETNNGGTNNGTTNNGVEGATYNYMMVQDITTGEGCDDDDPGSDLMYIELSESTGVVLAQAETVWDEQGTVGDGFTNDHIDSSILDGNPPELTNECVSDFNDQTVYAMGCGGKLSFKFKGSTQAPFTVIGGEHDVTIGEYGTGVCSGSALDSYELYGCTDDVDAAAGGFGSCTVLIGGEGEGITSFAVPAE